MRARLSAYGGVGEGEGASESAINKLGNKMSMNAYSSGILTHDSLREWIILIGCGQLTQRASARTLTLLCSDPTSSGNDLQGLTPLRPGPGGNSPPRKSRDSIADL